MSQRTESPGRPSAAAAWRTGTTPNLPLLEPGDSLSRPTPLSERPPSPGWLARRSGTQGGACGRDAGDQDEGEGDLAEHDGSARYEENGEGQGRAGDQEPCGPRRYGAGPAQGDAEKHVGRQVADDVDQQVAVLDGV